MTPAESPSCCCTDNPGTADTAKTLFVSVIMPVRNEARFIERTLAQLVGARLRPRSVRDHRR